MTEAYDEGTAPPTQISMTVSLVTYSSYLPKI